MEELYTVKQVSEILKLSEYAVKKLIKENKLKAFKWNTGYKVNEISLNLFMGHSIHDCIDKEQFEKSFNDFNELENGKIDKAKFYEYYCSLFMPGTELNRDYYIIKEPNFEEPKVENLKTTGNEIKEFKENKQIILTKTDICEILKYLNKIQEILEVKLK